MTLEPDDLIKLLALAVALAAYTGTVRRRIFDKKENNSTKAKQTIEYVLDENNNHVNNYHEYKQLQTTIREAFEERNFNPIKSKFTDLQNKKAYQAEYAFARYIKRDEYLNKEIALLTVGDIFLIISVFFFINSLWLKFHNPLLTIDLFPKDANASGILGIRWLIFALIWLIILHFYEAIKTFIIIIFNQVGKEVEKIFVLGANNSNTSPNPTIPQNEIKETDQTETTE